MSQHTLKLALLAGIATLCAAQAGSAAAQARQAYIVQLSDAPLASRTGGAPGLDVRSDEARRYVAQLEAKQRAVLALVPQAPVQYRYTTTLNGFAIQLTQQEAATLRAHPGVRQVTPDRQEQLQSGGAKTKLAPEQ